MQRILSRTTIAAAAALGLGIAMAMPAAATYPTGQTTFGQATTEVAYDDATGNLAYLLTPNKAPLNAPPRTFAPLYVVVYPTSSSVTTPLNCMHLGGDNCPDHGPAVAGAAMQIMPNVYGGGVLGHDHLIDIPGGADFNFQWEPILVLFTNSAAANTHITLDSQLQTAYANHQVIEIPLPQLAFNCAVVPAAVYWHGTPVTPV